ncbi:beta-methylgalactoside transporter [Bengtsoniella intestinalis]|uniref:galactose/methyl galactoside ABC transporter permease MglC n=1 Tax=Bengtsoniella intestinalis TaxID=3073143 RepID=UPI00391FBEC8
MKEQISGFKALSSKEKTSFIFEKLIDNALYILIALLIIYVVNVNSRFISTSSIINILTLSSTRLVMALGIAGCIVLTGTDLSAGRMLGLTACISASMLQAPTYAAKMYQELQWLPQDGTSIIIGQLVITMLLVMLVAGVLGAFNGFMVAYFKLHPFIVTLGTQLIIYGLSLLYVTFGTNAGAPLGGLDTRYTSFVLGGVLGDEADLYIPWVLVYAVVITAIMWVVWNKTVFGRNMFAVGCNEEAARVSGVPVFKTIVMVFALAGLMYGLTGFLESARVGSNTAATGYGYEGDAIAACVIGGVSFTGGVGKIQGVIMGVILLQIINAALIFLDVPGSITYIVRGGIILVACAIDMRKYLTKK